MNISSNVSATVQNFQFQDSLDIDCMKTVDGLVLTDIVRLHHWYRSVEALSAL